MGEKKRYRHTAYDDAFRTVEQECDDALIYFVNRLFGESYDLSARIDRLRNEHYSERSGDTTRNISDSHFCITQDGVTKRYHIECESNGYSGSIIIRLFEYAVTKAIDSSISSHDRIVIDLPITGLLVLRDKGNPPEHITFEIHTPAGSIEYDASVLCMADYSLEKIFDDQLYFLIPFYFFNLEKRFSYYEKSAEALQEFVDIYCDIIERVRLVPESALSQRSKGVIINEMASVVKRIASRKKNVSSKVGDIMGGKAHKISWLEKYDAAVEKGREEGREEGRKEGRKEGREERDELKAQIKKLEAELAKVKTAML